VNITRQRFALLPKDAHKHCSYIVHFKYYHDLVTIRFTGASCAKLLGTPNGIVCAIYNNCMRLRVSKVIGVACVATLAFSLSACASEAANEPEVTTSESGISPLDEFRSVLVGTPWQNELLPDEVRVQQFDQRFARVEELLAQCMKDVGFEYAPQPERHALILPAVESWRPQDRDWVAQYGFGVLSGLVRPHGSEYEAYFSEQTLEYLNQLSESENQAWYRAYYGPAS